MKFTFFASAMVALLQVSIGNAAENHTGYLTAKQAFQHCRTTQKEFNYAKNAENPSIFKSCFESLLQSKGVGDQLTSAYENPAQAEKLANEMTYTGGFYGGLSGYATDAEAIQQCRSVLKVSETVLFDCLYKALQTKGLGTSPSRYEGSYAEKYEKSMSTKINELIDQSSFDGCYKTADTVVCGNIKFTKTGKCIDKASKQSKVDPAAISNQVGKTMDTVDQVINHKTENHSTEAK